MKFLHTSDWHVGKTLVGRHRLDEQASVLAEIVAAAAAEQVDAVLVAGDLYDTTAPTAEAQKLLVATLLELADAGMVVVAMAGNHDHPGTLDAYRPLAAHAGIHLLGRPRDATSGGFHQFTARSSGETVCVAVLPFLSHRTAVRAAEIIANTPAQNSGIYTDLVRASIAALTEGFNPDAVNIVMAHLTCVNAKTGGGEREAHTVFDYAVPVSVFPADASYVALGHLHRRQVVPAAAPVHYCGSPLAIDFGEEENTPVVCVVEAHPGLPAQVRDIPITTARRFRTLRGNVEQLTALAAQDDFGDDVLRVYVTEPSYVGLREDVLHALPNAVQVRIDPAYTAHPGARIARDTATQTPTQLFADFCTERNIADPRLSALFDELYLTATSADQAD